MIVNFNNTSQHGEQQRCSPEKISKFLPDLRKNRKSTCTEVESYSKWLDHCLPDKFYTKTATVLPSPERSQIKETPIPAVRFSNKKKLHDEADKVLWRVPWYTNVELYNFGNIYEDKIYMEIHRFLEVDTYHTFCYVGRSKGNFIDLLHRKFSLLNSVTAVVPSFDSHDEIARKLDPGDELYIGVQDFFRENVRMELKPLKGGGTKLRVKKQFDRFLLVDCLKEFSEDLEAIFWRLRYMLPDNGKLLIIQRPADMISLPFFDGAKKFAREIDTNINGQTLDLLQKCQFDVEWDICCIPIIMPKKKWLEMIEIGYPPDPLEIMTNFERIGGLKELKSGMFRYSDEIVEFTDRLLFISASPKVFPLPIIERRVKEKVIEKSEIENIADNLKFELLVTEDIKPYLKDESQRNSQHKKKDI